MKLKFAILPLFSASVIAFSGSTAAQITSGNLVVERVGTGSATLGSASTAVFIDQFNTTGTGQTAVGVITIPTTGGVQLTNSGSASSEGLVTVSPNGLSLTIAGYNATTGVASIVNTLSSANARVANTIAADGTVTRAGSTGTAFSANNIRSAITNGTDVWAVGANTGVYDLTNSTTVSSTVTNARQVGIFAGAANGQLYLSTGSGTQGIYSVGSGTPTTTGQTATVMISTSALGGGSSPYAFSINTSKSVAYIADSTAGISKYTSSNGGTTWIRNGTYGNTLSGSLGTTGLTVDWSNPNAPVVFASSPTTLYKLTDTGGTGAASYGTATSLATAATNTAFRGVQLGVLPSVWTNNNGNASGSVDLATATDATRYSGFSTILANDSNLAFQNVNSGGGAQALSLNNNTTLTSVSSVNFKAGGFGTNSANTNYSLGGTGLILTGTSSTSAIGTFTASSNTYTSVLANNSGVTQTVSIPLTLGAVNQAFRAVSGDLAIDGTVTNGGNTLTVGGAANTTFGSSAVISGGGGLTKVEAGTLTLNGNTTFSGATDVKSGKLVVNGSFASTTTTVASSATLGGTGSLEGTTTIQNGGIHGPGNSPGVQSFTNLTYADGSIFSWEIDRAATQTRGTGYDGVNVSGTLAGLDGADAGSKFDAVFRVVIGDANFANAFWADAHTWADIFTTNGSTVIPDWTSIFGGGIKTYTGAGVEITDTATYGSFSFTPGTNSLSWSAVPEPTSALAGLLLGAGLLRRRRVA